MNIEMSENFDIHPRDCRYWQPSGQPAVMAGSFLVGLRTGGGLQVLRHPTT